MSKSARIELRAEPEQEERIRTAARLINQSITTFVVTAALERADEVIATWSTTTVPAEFFDQLLAKHLSHVGEIGRPSALREGTHFLSPISGTAMVRIPSRPSKARRCCRVASS
jgi:uncharacterized protein (DUF1778 family)